METVNNITMENTEKFEMVELANIVASGFNPRKSFNDDTITELAESIKASGVIQPIRVRPAEGGKYEIICGERRYRASLLAGKTTIPAVICEYSDSRARTTAIIENMIREDVTPLEECEAYAELLKTGDYSVQQIAQECARSEKYIRTRLKLTELIAPVKAMLLGNVITLPYAVELCKYSREIQDKVYGEHLKNDGWNSWKNEKPAELAKKISMFYTNSLDHFYFDKAKCENCPSNTKNQSLFDESCGRCTNRACLEKKSTAYVIKQAEKEVQEHPEALLCVGQNYDADAVSKLTEKGYEVAEVDNFYRFPVAPENPVKENFTDNKEYKKARQTYDNALKEFAEQTEKVRVLTESNRLITCLRITSNNVQLSYTVTNGKEKKQAKSPAELITYLEGKDKRNDEIRNEKTIADVKKLVPCMEYKGEFSADEEIMLYFNMLNALKKEHYGFVGIKKEDIDYCLSEEQKLKIASNLTDEIKILIQRDFISAHMGNAYRDNIYGDFLMSFTKQHIPEKVAEVEKVYQDIYNAQHQRINERKAVAEVQLKKEKAKGKAKKAELQIVA